MAYAFGRVMGALGKKDDQDEAQQNSNIFAPQAPQGQGQAQPGNDRVQSSSTEGSLSGVFNPNQSTGGAPAPQPAQTSSTGGNNRLFAANKGKVKGPADLNDLSNRVTGAQAGVQKEADSYIAGADDRFELPTTEAKDGAVSRGLNQDDTQALQSYVNTGDSRYDQGSEGPGQIDPISAYQNGPGQVDPFNSFTDTNVEDVGRLGNDAGIQGLFRQRGDAEYGANEAALDTSLLRKDAGFNQQRDALLNQNNAMLKAVADIKDSARGKAQDLRDSTYGSWKDAVENDLGGYLKGYEADALGAEKTFDSGLTSVAPKPEDIAALMRNLGMSPDAATQYTNGGAGFDPNKYVSGNVNADDTTWNDFVGEDTAAKWNRVTGLLGKGGINAGKYAGKKAQDYRGKFDQEKFIQDVFNKARQDEKAAAQAQPSGTVTEPPTDPTLGVSPDDPTGMFSNVQDGGWYEGKWRPFGSGEHPGSLGADDDVGNTQDKINQTLGSPAPSPDQPWHDPANPLGMPTPPKIKKKLKF